MNLAFCFFQALLVDLRSELGEVRASKIVLEKELHHLLLQLHAAQLSVHANSPGGLHADSADVIKKKLEGEMVRYRTDAMKEARLESEAEQLKFENDKLRNHVLSLQSELYGARLAARYLDKELAGRIQQIQLLGRDMKGNDHDKLWNQLEAEIYLHRHKTVIRACRGRGDRGKKLPLPPGHDADTLRRRQGVGEARTVIVEKGPEEGLGISITGGKEYGVPILVSEIHEGLAVDRSGGLYVGDSIISVNGIDLREVRHQEAVETLSQLQGTIHMDVVYVVPGKDSDDDSVDDRNQFAGSYRFSISEPDASDDDVDGEVTNGSVSLSSEDIRVSDRGPREDAVDGDNGEQRDKPGTKEGNSDSSNCSAIIPEKVPSSKSPTRTQESDD